MNLFYSNKQVSLILTLLVASCFLQACKPKSGQSELPKTAAPPARVLVRTRQKADCAADGYLWLATMHLDQAKRIQAANKALADNPGSNDPKNRDFLSLSSDSDIKVTEQNLPDKDESKDKSAKAEPEPSKPDTKDYDFLITWETSFKENTKKSFSAPLQITVEENVWLEKLGGGSQPEVWYFKYVLDGGSEIAGHDKTAEQQNDTVVIPKRSKVIKEIREFILKHR